MGGLAVDVSHIHDRLKKILLTPNGVIYLAKKGYFFDVLDADIKDKSKANALAKGLVLLQITWTVLQCLSRKVVGLPLSVLEVHVLVHAGCALMMYTLWFNKPLDVEASLDVTSRIPDEVLALMLVRTHRFGTEPHGNFAQALDYQPVRLQGLRKGCWPSRLAAEAEYLMYNPYMSRTDSDMTDRNHPVLDRSQDLSDSRSTQVPQCRSEVTATVPGGGMGGGIRQCYKTMPGSEIASRIQPRTDPVWSSSSFGKPSSQQPMPQSWTTSSAAESLSPAACQTPLAWGYMYDSVSGKFRGAVADYKVAGFGSRPASDVATIATISTGDFLSNGIGPRAFVSGPWQGDFVPHRFGKFERPGEITQITDELRQRIPLAAIEPSTIAHCSPLIVGLSLKDVNRWQLAGMALRNEMAPISLHPTLSQCDGLARSLSALEQQLDVPNSDQDIARHAADNKFLTFEDFGGTLRGAYFVISLPLHNILLPLREEWIRTGWRVPRHSQRDILLLRNFLHRANEVEELQMGPTTAVMMLPGLLYGTLHLTLWAYDFPTKVEGLLWRIASTVLVSTPVLAAVPLVAYTAIRKARGKGDDGDNKSPIGEEPNEKQSVGLTGVQAAIPLPLRICIDLAVALCVLVALLYIFSRVFIIVESFISLRHVPVGVYTD
ncbi:MAG: hypothetical protein Q9218_006194, partial [Villophora microphyllina]